MIETVYELLDAEYGTWLGSEVQGRKGLGPPTEIDRLHQAARRPRSGR